MKLYNYFKDKYGVDKPIFIRDIEIKKMSDANLRQQMKKLTDTGQIKRFDTGIYFIPKKSIFLSGSQLSKDKVIEQKYLRDENNRCGYISGLMFANQLGITTQVPMSYEVVSNKATKDYRETTLAKTRIVLRRPRTKITDKNYKVLQFLDLLKDIDTLAEITGAELQDRLIRYMKEAKLEFSMLEPYMCYYPDKLYKNMFEMRILNGIPAQR